MWKSKVVSVVVVSISCLCMCFSVFAQENAKSDVLASWHFDEGEGEIAKDSSGNRNDLKLVRTNWAEGKKGKCLSFKGESSYAIASNIPDSLIFLGNNEFTISAWIKPDYVYPKYYEIVNCCSCGNRGPGYKFFITYGMLQFRSGEGFGEGKQYWTVSTPKFKKGKIPEKVLMKGGWYSGVLDNRWYHTAVTYKDGIYRIYVDGSLAVEKKERPIKPNPKGKTLTISSDKKDQSFQGLIDEVEILNRAKTGEEIIDDALNLKGLI